MAESSRALNAQLIFAAKSGDTKAVNSLIAGGAKVDSVRDGKTALIHAAENGHTNTVTRLIKLGASVTKRSRGHNFKTALMHAAENGHTDTVARLVKLGASLTMYDGMTGRTALMYAAENGHTDTVVKICELDRSTLLQRTKDFMDSDGFYTKAAYEKVAVCVRDSKKLLIWLIDLVGEAETVITIAAQSGNVNTMMELIQKYRSIIRDQKALIAAVQKERAENSWKF